MSPNTSLRIISWAYTVLILISQIVLSLGSHLAPTEVYFILTDNGASHGCISRYGPLWAAILHYERFSVFTLCMQSHFSGSCCHLMSFFKIKFFEKIFPEHYQSVKRFGSRSGPGNIQIQTAI